MNTRSIRFRLTAWYSGLLVLLGLAFGAYCYWRLDHFIALYVTELFSHRAERIASTLLANVGWSGEAVCSEPGLDQRVTPTRPIQPIPLAFSDARLGLEGLPSRRPIAVLTGKAAYLRDDPVPHGSVIHKSGGYGRRIHPNRTSNGG